MEFKALAKGSLLLGIPNLILFAIAVTLIVYYFLNYTRGPGGTFTLLAATQTQHKWQAYA